MRSLRVPAAMFLAAASSLAVGPAVSRAASDVVVRSNERKTHDCRGGTAIVEGGFNVLTFRNCTEITVDGGDNTIDAGVVGAIVVSGADNKITWTESADGRRPRITNEGLGNVISSKRPPAGAGKTPTPAPSTARAAGKIRIDEDGRKEDHDCRGRSAVVNGDGNDLTFRNCDQVAVNGNANTVAVRAVTVVLINGGDNKVTWEPADDGSRPRVTDNGRGNTVSGKR